MYILKFILSIIGLLNAFYLTSLRLFDTKSCIVGSNCGLVLTSKYATIFTIPVSVLGICFFLSLVFIYQKKIFKNSHYYLVEFSLLLTGLFFSLWFVFAQTFLIKSFCFFCTLSALIVFSLFIVSVSQFIRKKNISSTSLNPPMHYLLPIIIFLILPIFISKGIQLILSHYTVDIKPKVFATTKIGDITFDQLKKQAGNSYITNQIKNYESNINYVVEILFQKEAQYFNLPIGAYYQLFMEYDLDLENVQTRTELLGLGGNLNQFSQFISKKQKNDKKNSKQRYLEFKQKLLRFYNVEFVTDISHLKTTISANPYGAIIIGPENAPINVTVFSDFLCSHCASFHYDIEKVIEDNPNLIRVDFRNFPHISKTSQSIAKIASCSGKQNQYIPVSNIFYKNQSTIFESKNKLSLDDLFSYLPENIDKDKLKKCVNSYEVMNLIQGDLNEVNKLKISSTPTIYVNGYIGDIATVHAEISKVKIKRNETNK